MNPAGRDRWIGVWREVAAPEHALPRYEELVSRYTQPQRHYHDLRHIAECLAEFDSAHDLALHPTPVELAVWFHDVVYDPRAQDNEERSAELARRWISEDGGAADLGESVASLIMATKLHDPALHPDAPLLVDVDLSILGRSEARFREYESQIRQEYNWVPEAAFRAKRAEILERFLARARIYSTEFFFRKYEHQARRNLRNSIHLLASDPISI